VDTMRHKQTQPSDANSAASYLDLAGEALLAGMTREQVIAQLVSRIRRDEGYLAYRKACNRRTRYDDQVTADMGALALAACWLSESLADAPTEGQAAVSVQTRRTTAWDRARRERRVEWEADRAPTGGCRHAPRFR